MLCDVQMDKRGLWPYDASKQVKHRARLDLVLLFAAQNKRRKRGKASGIRRVLLASGGTKNGIKNKQGEGRTKCSKKGNEASAQCLESLVSSSHCHNSSRGTTSSNKLPRGILRHRLLPPKSK